MAFKILSVVETRSDFIKVAALCEAIKDYNSDGGAHQLDHVLVHTGEQFGAKISELFFNDIELPKPKLFLGVGSSSQAVQSAKVMEAFESVLLAEKPNVVIVIGDVDSTAGCALVTKKTGCSGESCATGVVPKLAHFEAGLRSLDRTMPEEVNRIVTDSISDYLFTTEESANQNLRREGVPDSKIHFVGNVLIDTLLRYRSKVKDSAILNDLQMCKDGRVNPYAIMTLQKAAIVDDLSSFSRVIHSFLAVSRQMPIIFPAHPRTMEQIQKADLGDYFVDYFTGGPDPWDSRVRIRLVPRLGYVDYLQLVSRAKFVLTDSGGIQEETTILGIPCITMRQNTDRPVTLTHGTNLLVGTDPEKIILAVNQILHGICQPARSPRFWDGNAAKRIIQVLAPKKEAGFANYSSFSPMEP